MTAMTNIRPRRILDFIRYFNKNVYNHFSLTFAGWRIYAVITHIGRRSGKVYKTPVVAHPMPDGFITPLPYGADTDWCRNVLAKGGCTIRWHNVDYPVINPQVVDAQSVIHFVPAFSQLVYRPFHIKQFLKVMRVVRPSGP